MKKKFFLFVSLVLLAVQGWATEVNPANLQFSTDVGQTATQTISIEFSDAEIPPDPNTPVVMAPSYGNPLQSTGQASGDYSVSIQGAGSQMFSAEITMRSFTSNACTVKVSYNPTAEGTHQATLNVNCSSAGVPTVSVNLTGIASNASDDPFTHLPSGLGSVNTGNGKGLPEGFVLPGFNSDDYESVDENELRGGALAALVIQAINDYAPKINIWEVDESDPFNDVTVGKSATKTYYVWGHNLYTLTEVICASTEITKKFLRKYGVELSLEKLSMRLKLCLTEIPLALSTDTNLDALCESNMFSVNPSSLRPVDIDVDEGADRQFISVTYKPTVAGSHLFRFLVMCEFDFDGKPLPDWASFVPIVNFSGLEDHIGTATERTITADKSDLDFGNVIIGEEKPETFLVKGYNLAGDLTLVPSNSNYTVEPSHITAEDAAKGEGVPVTVTYTPTEEGCHDATLLISGGKAIDVPINLKGNCVVPSVTPSESFLNFGNVVIGQTFSQQLIIKGENLTSDLSLFTNNSCYKVSPDRISPEEAAINNTVTVTFTPTAVGAYNAILTIAGGGLQDQDRPKVNLSGTCVTNQSIIVTPSNYDFGTVNAGTDTLAIFTVKGNNLNDPIVLAWPQEDGFTITPDNLPATGGKVTVTFKPTYEGSYSQEITLSSGDAVAKINVVGDCVIPPTIKTNTTSLDFGTVVKGKTASKTFTVTGTNLTGNLTLSSNRPYFTVTPTTITAAEAAAGKTVTVTYTPTAGGNHIAILTISGGGAESKPVSLTGKCAAIDITPSSYDFGTVKEGESIPPHTFTVTGTNLSDRISIVSALEEGFTISPSVDVGLPSAGGKVTVTFEPTSGGEYTRVFTFSSGDAIAKLTVTGKCAAITGNPSSLDFGTVPVNKVTSKKFTIKGYYTGDLTLSTSSYFSVEPKTITAAEAKAGKEVTVIYKPSVRGEHAATLTIKDNSGNAADKKVSLSGKCAEITTSVSSLSFTTVSKTKTFTVKGYYLSGSLTLTCSGAPFSVSPKTITASQAANGVTVTVQCNAPLSLQIATGTITISGGSAWSKTVNLSYDSGGMEPAEIGMIEPEGEGDGGEDVFTNGSQDAYGDPITNVYELQMGAKVYAEGLSIIIESPIEQSAVISDIAGHIREVDLEAGRNEIPVNASGIYIVRIREKSTKLMLK